MKKKAQADEKTCAGAFKRGELEEMLEIRNHPFLY